MPKRSQEHMDARRRQILDGARRTFAHHGYEGATVARLERQIGLSRGAIFHHFPSKWDIFYALAEEDFSQVTELWVAQGYEAVVRFMVEQSPDWLGVYAELTRQIRTRPELQEQWERRNPELKARIEQRLQEQQRAGEIRADFTVEELAGFLAVVVDGLALHTSFGFREDVDGLLRLVHAALAPPA
ncbi:MAG TPA: TetR/AcrR family transcriptional regulator [Gaiellaceae bacterium]|nr:TetR/AcrR family transcriptional regulator [Gaiellaceae bacterium]